jgi:hypothetical protein
MNELLRIDSTNLWNQAFGAVGVTEIDGFQPRLLAIDRRAPKAESALLSDQMCRSNSQCHFLCGLRPNRLLLLAVFFDRQVPEP